MAEFAVATAVGRVESSCADSELCFEAKLDGQWSIDSKLHGGYLLAVLGRAASESAGEVHRHLTSITGTFLVPPDPGPAEANIEILHVGLDSTHMRGRLIQNGRLCIDALISVGSMPPNEVWWTSQKPIDLPSEDDCVLVPPSVPGSGLKVPLMEVVHQRLHPDTLGFAIGSPARQGEISGWQRLAEGRDWDPLSLLVALDPIPPASYDLGIPGWAPTVSLTAYIRARPAPGPVRVCLRANEVSGNRMDETVLVWDSQDRLVARATQLAAVRLPR